MAQGSKAAYTDKQKRKAAHIEASEKKSGKSAKRAEAIAWATVNKQDGGGKKTGSGKASKKSPARKKSPKKKSAKKAVKKTRRS